MYEVSSTPPEVSERLAVAYTQAGERRTSKLKWICRREEKMWWQSKYYYIDVDAREVVAGMLHVDRYGHLYRERGGGFGRKRHLIRVRYSDLASYEQLALDNALNRLVPSRN